MELASDSVAAVVADDAVVEALGVLLDDPTDDVDLPSRSDSFDPAHHRLVGAFDQQAGGLVDLAGTEREVRVAVHPLEIGGDVDVDDVAVLDHRGIGDAVADHLVDGGAHRLREPAIAQRRRIGSVVAHVFVCDCVDVIGRDPRGEHLTDRGQRIRCDPSRGPHDLDLLGGVEVVAAALIGVGASDVFGAGDVLRHTAFGGDGAGSE